jgi:hypothetical protein
MPLQNWEGLQKSATDPETIEQAIARLIGVHESDASAHLGPGESLEAHKNADVLDHPPGSVLGDKFSNKEFVFHFLFDSVALYLKSASGVTASLGGVNLDTGATINTVRYFYAPSLMPATYFNYNRDITFQFIAALIIGTHETAYIMAGGNGLQGDPPGVGFKFLNGALYACETVFGPSSFDEYTTLITGITTTANHLYRVEQNSITNMASFFVDGVLKATMTLHVSDDVGGVIFSLYVKNNIATQQILRVSGVYFSKMPFAS